MRKELIFISRMMYKRISNLRIILFFAQCPMDDEFNKNFNCFCCIAQGSLNLQIMLPCTGFVPGQTITTTIQYSGTPDVRIRKVSTKLVQVSDG